MKKLQTKIPPPIITLAISLLMWVLGTNFPIIVFDFLAIFYIGLSIIAFGLYIVIISFFNFLKNKTTVNPISPEKTTSLVIEGFYRYSRNPMYLGMLLILIGTALLFGSLSGVLLLPIFVLLMNYLQIEPEEQALEKIFGLQYLDYNKKVRRWL